MDTYTSFIKQALRAGFTDEQADFMCIQTQYFIAENICDHFAQPRVDVGEIKETELL